MTAAPYGTLPPETEIPPQGASPVPPGARRAAVVDLGSNSIRLLLAQVDAAGRVQILNCVKSMVRLGEGAFATKCLQPEAMERTLAVLRTFASTCRSYGAERVCAVATASVREASNGREFTERVKQETGIEFHVISGPEEARLVTAGVESGLPLASYPRAFMDIGGGSTEFSVSENGTLLAAESLHIGCVRLADLFFRKVEGRVPWALFEDVQDYVREKAVMPFSRIRPKRPEKLYASSGTAGALAEMAAALRGEKASGTERYVTREEAEKIARLLCRSLPEERLALPGMSARRLDVIIPGAAIFLTAMEELGFDRFEVTDRGLRDGVLLQYLENQGLIPGKSKEREQKVKAVQGFAKNFSADLRHAEKVAGYAAKAFNQCEGLDLVRLSPDWKDTLVYASWLQETGLAISYNKMAEHSAYIVANSEMLGFTEQETMRIAAVIFRSRYMKKDMPSFIALRPEEWKDAGVAGLILKVAEDLDKSHRGAVEGFAICRTDSAVEMRVRASVPSPIERESLKRVARALTKEIGQPFEIIWPDAA